MNQEFKQSFKRGLKRGIPIVILMLLLMMATGLFSSCGRASEPEFPEGTTYPRTYPSV